MIIFLFCSIVLIGCGPGSDSKTFEGLNSSDQAKFTKYLIQGKAIYKQNCINCHQANGAGLRKLIPPLAGSDYLEDNQREVACLIKYGAKIPIKVNGVAYLPTMPAHTPLTHLEIAEVITYINNSWGNELGFVDAKMINGLLTNCIK